MSVASERSDRLVTVFGGAGFIGRHVVRALAADGWRVRVASRRPDLAFALQTLGRVGQIHAVQANLRYPASVAAALRGAQAAVNLVGILTKAGRQNFEAVQGFGARAVAQAAAEAGIGSLVQLSAIGADPNSPSAYARSKAHGEAAVREFVPGAIILRPSIVFGPEDDFFNRFAAMARVAPALPLVGGGHTRLQPVYVGDVAEAVAKGLQGLVAAGTYELGGPEVKTFRELMAFVCTATGRRRLLVPLPFPLASVAAAGSEIASTLSFGLLPPKTFAMTREQVTLLRADNVVSGAALAEGRTLGAFGIVPANIETIVPPYLVRFRKTGQFERMTA